MYCLWPILLTDVCGMSAHVYTYMIRPCINSLVLCADCALPDPLTLIYENLVPLASYTTLSKGHKACSTEAYLAFP